MHRIRSNAHVSRLGSSSGDQGSILPVSNSPAGNDGPSNPGSASRGTSGGRGGSTSAAANEAIEADDAAIPMPPSATVESKEQGEVSAAVESTAKPRFFIRVYTTTKEILCSSIFNVLLVFVPVGIAMEFVNVPPYVVFAVNAVAIVPLAGLLSHATEAVAVSLGDAMGALLNVTFGNAVELIIFIIALVKNEIRIVQASLVGSILANLLLILGMCFLFGGLRFREQIYNSTVTQMSACLLSLSVTSLVLPTAFHASFADTSIADQRVLQLSRGSSIILLLVYILYLLFQLKSHAYMYESTPQHIIDEESHPGVLASIMNSSSSSESSSDSDSDSTGSSLSNTTANRIRKAFRRHRKSSVSSKDAPTGLSLSGTPHVSGFASPNILTPTGEPNKQLGAIMSGDEADSDDDDVKKTSKGNAIIFRDPEEQRPSLKLPRRKKHKRKSQKSREEREECEERRGRQDETNEEKKESSPSSNNAQAHGAAQNHVAFSQEEEHIPPATESARRPFAVRNISVLPAMPRILSSTVFSAQNPTGTVMPAPRGSSVPRAPYGLRRTTSLPDRLNRPGSFSRSPSNKPGPPLADANSIAETLENDVDKNHLSRTSAVILLLVSTGLVALCAEFLVGSINYMVSSTPISEAFIGLIILPIVGNAAEHVTAVTVASKNKMDLAIGVAVGSSIQIALFVTPVVVLLGWIMARPMSLYFTLFETVSLFVSAFIINFLILDGRSNYLEGALLMAAYVIIAVAAFFYPDQNEQSEIGGAGAGSMALAARSLAAVWGW